MYLGIVLVLAGLIGCSNPYDLPQEVAAPQTGERAVVERGVTAPIPIGSAVELGYIGDPNHPTYPLSGSYILTASFPLAAWTPIGDENNPFTGAFDGNSETITLRSFDAAAVARRAYLGIFAYIGGTSSTTKAEVKDLTIASLVKDTSELTTGQAVGLLAGYTENANITGITLSGSFGFKSVANIYVGGVVGYAQSGTVIEDSAASVTMNIDGGSSGGLVPGMSYNFVGGIVGLFKDGADILDCHNTGNISAICTAARSQVFCGGIAGGSYYQFTTDYQGSIQDCSSTGATILAQCPGFWSWAGGIAGCIVGDGDGKLPETVTRIVRCYATGTVTVEDSTAGWPYVGGIVGYNYYGALVSQCYFQGNVLSNSGSDYAGGIAGYNSRFEGHNSRIENCWSYGLVRGLNNAGGIVGQNQVDTYVANCYSRANVITTNTSPGIGGIAGLNASELQGSISGCVALNESIYTVNGSNIHRVVGLLDPVATLDNNYAWDEMPIETDNGTYTADIGLDRPDGADCPAQPDVLFYEVGLNWDFTTVWEWDSAGYPRLQWQTTPIPVKPYRPASI
jgi:hypothetical protein